jgi:transposase
MAQLRTSVAMQKQILELIAKDYSKREVARMLGVSKNTVKRILKEHKVSGDSTSKPEPIWSQKINWKQIHREHGLGATIGILHKEHAPDVNYTTFWRRFKGDIGNKDICLRLEHRPGEKSFYDFADGITIYDPITGAAKTTELFCGVLAFSSLTYAEFTWTQKREDLIRPIENAFEYFGGVTPYVTVDNQRAAINKAHIYDPTVNKIFVDFANHVGFAVMPARPYKPRDKAANEAGIGVIQRQFYQEVRHRRFTSLHELNQALREYIKRLNNAPMKDWDNVTRLERAQAELHLLKSLPQERYQLSEWKCAKVHSDCHIQVGRKFYSVPFQYVGQRVDVRITDKLIEVFDSNLTSIAAHAKIIDGKIYQTNPDHYPEEKLQVANYSIKKAIQEAERIGPETFKMVSHMLTEAQPLRYLRRIQGILRLVQSKRVSITALEFAVKQGVTFNRTQYQYIKSTAEVFDKNGMRPARAAPYRDESQIYLHKTLTLVAEENHDQ